MFLPKSVVRIQPGPDVKREIVAKPIARFWRQFRHRSDRKPRLPKTGTEMAKPHPPDKSS